MITQKFKMFKSVIPQIALIFIWMIARVRLFFRSALSERQDVIFIMPGDPFTVTGSRGDEAMLTTIIEEMVRVHHDKKIMIATTNNHADMAVQRLGCIPVRINLSIFTPISFTKSAMALKPAIGVVIGADVVDGHYSPTFSIQLLIIADILSRSGTKTLFTGFSLYRKINTIVSYTLRQIHKDIRINIRDPISFDRYRSLSNSNANLVADVAFLLNPAVNPSDHIKALVDWIERQKNTGKMVVALNVHPMLFPLDKDLNENHAFVEIIAGTLADVSCSMNVSWVLLPHDDRLGIGDVDMLNIVFSKFSKLDHACRGSIYIQSLTPSAKDIKYITGLVDAVITGRMHLAIAALGSGSPVLVYTYQDKFAGLLALFELPEWLIIEPNMIVGKTEHLAIVSRFIRERERLASIIKTRLPIVKSLAHKNLNDV